MCIKLKYIQISLDIYEHVSYHAEEVNISSVKTHQIPNKWQHLTYIKVPFSSQNLQNDIVTPRL